MANLYYQEDLDADAFEVGETVEITGDEARHALRVSRLRVGEQTLIGNGRGVFGKGEVVRADRDRFAVRITATETVPDSAQRFVLVQALAKGDRDERAVEQATEFGVDVVVPWQAARSVSRWDGAGAAEKAAKGVAKWQRIAREAAKQSVRARVPEVREVIATAQLCDIASDPDAEVIVLHPRGSDTLSAWAAGAASQNAARANIYLVVGPEGGLSGEELDLLEAAGARVLVLGNTVLRTSSAGPAALAVLNVALNRW